MPRPPKFSDEEIISTGEKLTAEFRRQATATEIHKALDGLGRFGRIREIWDNHMSAKEQDTKAEIPLADTTLGQISNVVTMLEQSVQDLIQKLIREMTTALAMRDDNEDKLQRVGKAWRALWDLVDPKLKYSAFF